MEEQFTIETPEAVSFSYTLAGIGSRYMAALIDSTIMGLLIVVLLIALQLTRALDFLSLATALAAIVLFAILFGYYTFFETVWRGQSPGKRIMNLRVLKADGLPIGFTDALLRNIVRFVDFLPAAYGLGLVVMFFDPKWRRLGDMAANTVVVRENAALRLAQIAVQPHYAANSPQPLVYRRDRIAVGPGMLPSGNLVIPNIERLSNTDYQLVRDYLLRRPSLDWTRQDVLDLRLTRNLATKLQPPFAIRQPIFFLYQVVESYEMSQLQ